MSNRNKRKLVKTAVLQEIASLNKQGVPLAKIVRDNDLDVSLPHLTKLIHFFNLSIDACPERHITEEDKVKLLNSLFPEWMQFAAEAAPIQVQPASYKYKGLFPWGIWIEVSE